MSRRKRANADPARTTGTLMVAPIAFRHRADARHRIDGNANDGKRHAPSMTDAFLCELAEAEASAYTPLTVSTPLRDSRGRRNPRMGRTSYTV